VPDYNEVSKVLKNAHKKVRLQSTPIVIHEIGGNSVAIEQAKAKTPNLLKGAKRKFGDLEHLAVIPTITTRNRVVNYNRSRFCNRPN
jgi:hypothetical protein